MGSFGILSTIIDLRRTKLQSGAKEDAPIESNLLDQRLAAAAKSRSGRAQRSALESIESDLVMALQKSSTECSDRCRCYRPEGASAGYACPEAFSHSDNRVVLECPDRVLRQRLETYILSGMTWRVNGWAAIFDIVRLPKPAEPAGRYTRVVHIRKKYQDKEDSVGADLMRQTERTVMLQVIDDQWRDHLFSMDQLKDGVALLIYAKKDPLKEYKIRSFALFQEMMDRIEDETVRRFFLDQTRSLICSNVKEIRSPAATNSWAFLAASSSVVFATKPYENGNTVRRSRQEFPEMN